MDRLCTAIWMRDEDAVLALALPGKNMCLSDRFRSHCCDMFVEIVVLRLHYHDNTSYVAVMPRSSCDNACALRGFDGSQVS